LSEKYTKIYSNFQNKEVLYSERFDGSFFKLTCSSIQKFFRWLVFGQKNEFSAAKIDVAFP